MFLKPEDVTISNRSTVSECMKMLTQVMRFTNTIFVINSRNILVGSLTDGDIRRALLKGFTMESKAEEICKKNPIVAPENMPEENLIQLIKINNITDFPLIGENGKLIAVKRLKNEDIDTTKEKPLAMIMAGGEGMRLRPLTENEPKPMLKISGKPILHIIIELLRDSGFKKVIINIRYLGESIKDYFNDGSDFSIEIEYITEAKPMGTAGSIGLIPEKLRPTMPFLVLNGVLMTRLNFMAFRNFHMAAGYDFTLCGRPYKVDVPFGYPVIEGDIVTSFIEKPVFNYLVNSGIYCISPELIDRVPVNEYFDMPDLIKLAIEDKKRVGVFPLGEDYHEIGGLESYKTAEEFYKKHFLMD